MHMKMQWDDVIGIFDDTALWENGHDIYWYRLMWSLLEYRNMTDYSSEADKVKVISRAFALIRIYKDFVFRCCDDEEIRNAFEAAVPVFMDFMYDEGDVRDIFAALNEELGPLRTFYSMFITCIEFRNGQICYMSESSEDCCDEEYPEDYPYEDDSEEYYSLTDQEYDEEDCDENFYSSFEDYIKVLATSSMSIISDFTPEKMAGYIYLARNMK